MWPAALAILSYLGVSWLIQWLLCWCYARDVRTATKASSADGQTNDQELPRICVLMPLRGADPYLEDAIRSVVENPYPRLELRIIVDSAQDPAREIAEGIVSKLGMDNIHVSLLGEKPPERSLICSSLIQGFDEAEANCDLIAFCAADMTVPSNWYADMADAMRDPEVGSLLGNRWYMPAEGRWGSLVRYAWNAGAVVLMWLFKIPWGGALALRPADVHRSNLREFWGASMVEDVPVYKAMRQTGLKMKFVPSLTIVNREEIGLAGAFVFLKRQMIWARLYHPRWSLVVAHSLMGLLSFVGPLAVAGWAVAIGRVDIATWLVGGVVAYLVGLAILVEVLESAVRTVLRSRNEDVTPMSIGSTLCLVPAIALTQLLYPIAVIACCFAREVHWRGIRYRILGRGKVQMVEYEPFRAADQSADGATSI